MLEIILKQSDTTDGTIVSFYFKVNPAVHPDFHSKGLDMLKETRPTVGIIIEAKSKAFQEHNLPMC